MADENRNVLVDQQQVDNMNNLNDKKNFVCGVVEGFYGRPWTPEQRKDLFVKQQKWGMNAYLYAPKDDYKHRAYWRELYTVEEAEHLSALIAEAKRHNVMFYYAISPGLDITYSSQKEMSSLKRKLEQVAQLGCNAFAILFDDIDPEMSSADKEVFQSFAHAQVTVTNEIYTHLGQPKFMFCPTQYCSTRAIPTVLASEYLTTLGSKLAPAVDIMWTGPRVISKDLTVEHIREVSEVMKRPPVIWDNLHANDYDQARVFLGPYCGRSPDLIPLLRGVMTNPNCEYGPNFVAIHTLAQWSRSCSISTTQNNHTDDAVSADIKLETEGDDASDDCPSNLPPNAYHPRRALRLALQEWLAEFSRPVLAFGSIQQPQIPLPAPVPILPSVNTCMSLTATTPVTSVFVAPTVNILESVPEVMSQFAPPMNPVMNSLISEKKVIVKENTALSEPENTSSSSSREVSLSSSSCVEPMDCNPSPTTTTPSNAESDSMCIENQENGIDSTVTDNTTEKILSSECDNSESSGTDAPSTVNNSSADEKAMPQIPVEMSVSDPDPDDQLTIEDLTLLADLFYLPFEHGRHGVTILSEFNWLKVNSYVVIEHNKSGSETQNPEVQEWFARAAKFEELVKSVRKMTNRLYKMKNRSLLYELYPYVWDMRGVICLLNSFVEWLALGQVSSLVSNYVHGNYTWFSKGWREAFMSGDQEPWVFRGGLTAELQRLIPVDASNDLFVYRTPEVPLQRNYIIRPYLSEDREKLYKLCLETCDDGGDATQLYKEHPNLPGDMSLGSYLKESKEMVMMVVEDDDNEVLGFCAASISCTAQAQQQQQYQESIKDNYPKVVREEGVLLSPCEEVLARLQEAVPSPPEILSTSHPAVINLALHPSILDDSIGKRMLTCILASIRSKGVFGGHVIVRVGEKNMCEIYSRMGFVEVVTQGTNLYMGRSF